MHSGIIAVWDSDREYAEKLCNYLRKQGGLGPSAVSFSDKDRLRQAIEHRQVAVTIAGGDAREEAWLHSSPLVFLTEERRDLEEDNHGDQGTFTCVYKYQPADRIVQAVSRVSCRDAADRRALSGKQTVGSPARIRGVYSPLGGCLKTSFGLVMGCLLAERKRCLFLSLEAHAGFRTLFGRQYPIDLADLFAVIRRGEDPAEGLADALQPFGKLHYIPPVIWPVDIREAEFSELKELLHCLAVSGRFDEIVVDVGRDLARPERVLALCDEIYRLEKEDVFSQAKLSEYDCYLRVSGCEGIIERTKKIPMSQLSAGVGATMLDQWQRWEQMIPIVRQILEETEDGDR